MFNKCVGHADTLYMRGVVMICHEFQYGTSHAAFSYTVFYGEEATEVTSYFM